MHNKGALFRSPSKLGPAFGARSLCPSLHPPTPTPQPPASPQAGSSPPSATRRDPPPDILPHPSGATVADLTRPEQQFDPHAWRPDVHHVAMDLPGLGNMGSTKQYWKHEVSQCFRPEGTALPLSGSGHSFACVLKVLQGRKALQVP